ncbi:hypothetical protein A28LD_1658 [Idiomarina sp. A28L]|uniref:outer membrane protein n=1 Tax=Idiomarina sp. A28L TaxID=1036674 RepID=UPI0002138CDD|nr:outer membrane beta-barrel protein [Idiomarina sp. A28L]EGN74645.1 hypothetical protein A28LD_1658 [Idiomarina sp. A28L]
MKYFSRKNSIQSKLAIAALIGSATMLSAAAAANTAPNFNNVGVSYVSFDISNQSISGYGFEFENMLTDKLYVDGDYVTGSDSSTLTINNTQVRSKFDFGIVTANIGYQFFQQDSVVGYVSGGFANLNSETTITLDNARNRETSNSNGWNAQVGLRQALTERLELDASVRHIQASGEDDQIISLGARYKLADKFAVGVNYSQLGGDFSYLAATISYRF